MAPISDLLAARKPSQGSRISWVRDGQFLAKSFLDEASLPFYELVAQRLGRLRIRQLYHRSMQGNDPKRLFTYLARKQIETI